MATNEERQTIAPIETAGEAGLERCKAVFRYAEAGRCISGVVHDLNNYLGAIMAYADLVELEENLGSEPRRMLGEIHSAVGRCSDLLSNLTTLTRSHTTNVNLVEPASIVKRVLALRHHRHNVGEVSVNFIAEEGLPTMAVDLPALQFAFLCLVLNAEENLAGMDTATLGPRKIVLKAERAEDGGVLFKIRDSGPSMDDAAAEQALAPFTSRHASGRFGLGLSTAREIVEAHRGTLGYKAGEGFLLKLPANTGYAL